MFCVSSELNKLCVNWLEWFIFVCGIQGACTGYLSQWSNELVLVIVVLILWTLQGGIYVIGRYKNVWIVMSIDYWAIMRESNLNKICKTYQFITWLCFTNTGVNHVCLVAIFDVQSICDYCEETEVYVVAVNIIVISADLIWWKQPALLNRGTRLT